MNPATNERRRRIELGRLAGFLLLCGLLCGHRVQAQQPAAPAPAETPGAVSIPGVISGSVTDDSGDEVRAARITLTQGSAIRSGVTDEDGRFHFDAVSPGAFKLTASADGFAPQTVTGVLHAGESYEVPAIMLLAATSIEVRVRPSSEVAQEQIKAEEKQRVLAFIPNFYVSYAPNPAPMSTRQKYELAWRSSIDPINVVFIAAFAGIQQAGDTFPGFGQGAAGYGKRFGAGYANFVTATFITGAILPGILKQDPRYLYKGTGSLKSRAWYAIETVFICRNDNGRWAPNYSNVLGNLAAGGLSNLYYAPSDRNGLALTFENAGVTTISGAIGNLLQEFVIRRFTPSAKKP